MARQRQRPHRTNSLPDRRSLHIKQLHLTVLKNPMGLARIRRQAQKKSPLAVISTDRAWLAESHYTEIMVQLQSCLLLLKSRRHIRQKSKFQLAFTELQSAMTQTMTMLPLPTVIMFY